MSIQILFILKGLTHLGYLKKIAKLFFCLKYTYSMMLKANVFC